MRGSQKEDIDKDEMSENYRGGTSVQEYDNAATTPTVEYIRGSDYGGGVGGILYTLRANNPSYTHTNKRGDITAKSDSTGSLTYLDQYQAFGNQVATSGSTLLNNKSDGFIKAQKLMPMAQFLAIQDQLLT